jgi:hypothetical protein
MSEWKQWYCRDCGHLVIAKEEPDPIRWTDLHVCQDWIPENEKKEEQNV